MILFFFALPLAIILIFYIALRIPRLSAADQPANRENYQVLHDWLELIHKKGKFNGVVLLSRNGRSIFTKSCGDNGSLQSPKPLTENSSFNVASVSKQFTAMGIVLLNQQAKLNYKNRISDFIPELSAYSNITIEHLLHHTSGLPDYMMLAVKHHRQSEIFTTKKMLSLYQEYSPPMRFKPGSRFEYSNTGYVVLAEIVARVSGMLFSEFMAKHIFQPLSMHDSQVFNLLSTEAPQERVYGFKRKFWIFGGKKQANDLNYLDGVAGDGGVYTSVCDLNKWHTALTHGILIPKIDYQIAYNPAVLQDGSRTNYGFGWLINSDNSVEHTGGWQGFTSYIFRNLENSDLLVIVDNSSNPIRLGFIAKQLKHFLHTISM